MTDSELAPVIRGLLELTRARQRIKNVDAVRSGDSTSNSNHSLDEHVEVDDAQSVPRFAQSSRPVTSSPILGEANMADDLMFIEDGDIVPDSNLTLLAGNDTAAEVIDLTDPPAPVEAQIDLPIQAQPVVLSPIDDDLSFGFPSGLGQSDLPWLDTDMSLQDILAAGESPSESPAPVDIPDPVQPSRVESKTPSSLTSTSNTTPIQIPQKASGRISSRLRRIAPAQPEKLPELILQPSENAVRVRDTPASSSPVSETKEIDSTRH